MHVCIGFSTPAHPAQVFGISCVSHWLPASSRILIHKGMLEGWANMGTEYSFISGRVSAYTNLCLSDTGSVSQRSCLERGCTVLHVTVLSIWSMDGFGWVSPSLQISLCPANSLDCSTEKEWQKTSFYVMKALSRHHLSAEDCGQVCCIAGHWRQQPSSTICVQ